MEIIKTNLPENATMETLYDMFESENRTPMKELAGSVVNVQYYAIYTDENARGENVKLLSVMYDESAVAVTNSASAIRAFDRLIKLCEMAHQELNAIEVTKEKSRNNREFISVKLA